MEKMVKIALRKMQKVFFFNFKESIATHIFRVWPWTISGFNKRSQLPPTHQTARHHRYLSDLYSIFSASMDLTGDERYGILTIFREVHQLSRSLFTQLFELSQCKLPTDTCCWSPLSNREPTSGGGTVQALPRESGMTGAP